MKYLITSNGAKILTDKINEIVTKLKDVQSQKGEAYENGGNGWHDNFAYEQLVIEEGVLIDESINLTNILKNSIVVHGKPTSVESVQIGSGITLVDSNGRVYDYLIAGYGEGNLKIEPKMIEYLAPIIYPFFGKKVGHVSNVKVGDTFNTLELSRIWN